MRIVGQVRSQLICRVEINQTLLHTGAHRLLSFSHPDTRIEVFFVGLVLSFWIADLLHDVVLLAEHVISDARQVSILEICVEIYFDHAIANGILVLLLRAATATVEHEEHWLIGLCALLVLNKFLVLLEELWVKFDVTRLVNTVNVAETSSNGKIRADLLECGVDVVDVFRLSVK